MNSCCITLSRGVRPLLGMCIRSNGEFHIYEYYDSWLFTMTTRVLTCYSVDRVYIAEEQEALYKAIKEYNVVKIARKYFEMDCCSNLYGMLAHKILCNYSPERNNALDWSDKDMKQRNTGAKVVFKVPDGRMLIHKNTVEELNLLSDVVCAVRNTKTKMGERLLREELCQPYTDKNVIHNRHEKVKLLKNDMKLRKAIEAVLKRMPDMNQLIYDVLFEQRVTKNVGRVVELLDVIEELKCILGVEKRSMDECTAITCEAKNDMSASCTKNCDECIDGEKNGTEHSGDDVSVLGAKADNMKEEDELQDRNAKNCTCVSSQKIKKRYEIVLAHEISCLEQFNVELPAMERLVAKDGIKDSITIVKENVNVILDIKRKVHHENMEDILSMAEEIEREADTSVRIHYDSTKGYVLRTEFIGENGDVKIISKNSKFITFSTTDVEKINMRMRKVRVEIENISEHVLMEVIREVQANIGSFQRMSDVIAELDLIVSFVNFSKLRNCCFPKFTDRFVVSNTYNLVIQDVKQAVTIFSCNSLNKNIVTGPNMGGKTTYLKTIAVVSILAQIGSPINADSAEIKIHDEMFTKLAQHDNFEKEWQLAANILEKSTDRSLILLDEMGRSTDYNSGLSFSVAFILALHKGTLFFSTHFLDMVKYLKHIRNVNFVGVNDFKAKSGVCGYFKGIELAKKYFPKKVTEHAEKVCKKWKITKCDKIKLQVALKIAEGGCDESCINRQENS
ncbi:hypothetical protein VCUG_02604 [Vavraia culicis subsp. floridensis]|uniref:DNA mismatch repair proteins mutS family domain-containing protein n=1 Tax=Vavraia culicis (isolate floridensis) TaxID=948595 RepID=L2GQJ2_VAVCU|nr:uncharacterized protein VCUG_02604 [Vavraia culicis subsp. floridensis]ELA45911.1 hypothetical protein VCUG_02604 [Vavraia culicis subsp. floridensis]